MYTLISYYFYYYQGFTTFRSYMLCLIYAISKGHASTNYWQQVQVPNCLWYIKAFLEHAKQMKRTGTIAIKIVDKTIPKVILEFLCISRYEG